MGAVGGFTLELYCDNPSCPDRHDYANGRPAEYVDEERGSRCRAAARKAGWVLGPRGEATCPKCSGHSSRSIRPMK